MLFVLFLLCGFKLCNRFTSPIARRLKRCRFRDQSIIFRLECRKLITQLSGECFSKFNLALQFSFVFF